MEIQINQTLQRTLQANTKMDELYIIFFLRWEMDFDCSEGQGQSKCGTNRKTEMKTRGIK